jgi:hypothetical protein
LAGVPSHRLECRRLKPHAILAGQNALDDLDHCLMPIGRPRVKCSFVMRGDNIDKQVARFLFADDLEFAQGNEKRFANTKGHLASGFIEACLLCHDMTPPSNLARPGARGH